MIWKYNNRDEKGRNLILKLTIDSVTWDSYRMEMKCARTLLKNVTSTYERSNGEQHTFLKNTLLHAVLQQMDCGIRLYFLSYIDANVYIMYIY